ncbi:MAG: hypothetical protein R2681_06485 [Pyrinomonadaceae bacterium]
MKYRCENCDTVNFAQYSSCTKCKAKLNKTKPFLVTGQTGSTYDPDDSGTFFSTKNIALLICAAVLGGVFYWQFFSETPLSEDEKASIALNEQIKNIPDPTKEEILQGWNDRNKTPEQVFDPKFGMTQKEENRRMKQMIDNSKISGAQRVYEMKRMEEMRTGAPAGPPPAVNLGEKFERRIQYITISEPGITTVQKDRSFGNCPTIKFKYFDSSEPELKRICYKREGDKWVYDKKTNSDNGIG